MSLAHSHTAVSVVAGLLSLLVGVRARGQSSVVNPDAIRQRRIALLLKVGKQPLSQFAGEINQLALDSERCRAEYGSKSCGLLQEPLAGAKEDQLFDYYVRKPAGALIGNQRTQAVKSDWSWGARANAGPK